MFVPRTPPFSEADARSAIARSLCWADALRFLGYEVKVAYSGPDGVRLADAMCPHVVICDIGLPGMDGFAVAGALRGNPKVANARLIALTGYGQEEDRKRTRAAGFDEHLTKPADPTAARNSAYSNGCTGLHTRRTFSRGVVSAFIPRK